MFFRAVFACLAMFAGGLTAVSSASAGSTSPEWKVRSASVRQDPSVVVRKAPSAAKMQVVVATETANGPRITTTPAADVGEAKTLVANAQDKSSTIAVSMAQPVSVLTVNDPKRSSQWALNTLSAESCWTKTKGAGVIVAVVDTGVRASNRDLGGRILAGYNAVTGSLNGGVDNNGHGTHVAGIIAANADNGRGVAGFAPQVKILPVRVVDSNGSSNTGYLASGIIWAANHGADVINISMGGTGGDLNLDLAIQYAAAKNVVVVAAAGNDKHAGNATHYPAAYPNVIGVGATDSSNRIASYSNTGSYVDVSAPGTGIWSTYTSPDYASMSGTSMASPYVAATAALAISETGAVYSAATITKQITSSARDLGSAGRDNTYGYGLISPISVLALAGGGSLNSTSTVSLPAGTIVSGGYLSVSSRLMTTRGANLIGKSVRVTATYNGTAVTKTVTTNSQGRLSASFRPTAKATVRVAFVGDATSRATAVAKTFTRVVPMMAIARSGRTLTLTNSNLYGQMVQVQKYYSGSWHTIGEARAYKTTWRLNTGKGKFRVQTAANSRLYAWNSSSWRTY